MQEQLKFWKAAGLEQVWECTICLPKGCKMVPVRNAIKRVFYGLAGERSRLMNWPDPSPAQSLSLVVS